MKPLNAKTNWFEAICYVNEELAFWKQYVSLTDLNDSNKDIRCTLSSVSSLTQDVNSALTKLKVMCQAENSLNLSNDVMELMQVISSVGCSVHQIQECVDQMSASQCVSGQVTNGSNGNMNTNTNGCGSRNDMNPKNSWSNDENTDQMNRDRRICGELKGKLENVKQRINKGNKDHGRERLDNDVERGVLKENFLNN